MPDSTVPLCMGRPSVGHFHVHCNRFDQKTTPPSCTSCLVWPITMSEGHTHDPPVEQSSCKLAILERNWRRVASTHTFEELMKESSCEECSRPKLKLLVLGVMLILVGIISLVFAIFAMLVAPFLPQSSNRLVAAIQADSYYHLLIPLTIPVTIFMVFLNWFSMKLFKHNS